MKFLKYLWFLLILILIAMLLIVGCGEEPKVEGTKSLTALWDIDPYNLKVDLKLSYLDGLMWRAEIKDAGRVTASVKATPNQGKPSYETKYGKRLGRVNLFEKDYSNVKATPKEAVQGKPFYKTKYGKRLGRSIKGNFLTLKLESSDGFDIQKIDIYGGNCRPVMTKEDKLNYYECQGKISSVSKETFSLIEKLRLASTVL